MDVWIKLKIKLDTLTGRVSVFCSHKPVRYFLQTLLWSAVAFLVYDAYVYGINTGDPALFFTVVTVLFISLFEKKKPDTLEQKNLERDIRPRIKPGMKGICEKCGAKVTINFGDAYHTLCEKCT